MPIVVDNNRATGSFSELMAYPFAASLVGLLADPTDVRGCDLVWGGSSWSGKAGIFLTLESAMRMTKTNLAAGSIFQVGDLKYTWDGTNLLTVPAVAGGWDPGARWVHDTLVAVTAQKAQIGTRASATDIPNVTLEWMAPPAYPNGAWFGSVGFHANQASLDAVPTIYLATGSTAMVAGISKTWNGSYWIAPAALGGGIVYDGTTYPLPLTAPYKGYKIAVVNPAVPDGWSTLKSTGTTVAGFVPPKGELIASVWRGASPLVDVVPGVIGRVEIFGATGNLSKAIPGYMIPAGLVMKIQGGITIKNASGVAGAQVQLTLSGSDLGPSAGLWKNVAPVSSGIGLGQNWSAGPTYQECAYVSRNQADPTVFSTPVNNGPFPGNTVGSFVGGANRLLAYATTTSITDRVQFDGCQITSEGNL